MVNQRSNAFRGHGKTNTNSKTDSPHLHTNSFPERVTAGTGRLKCRELKRTRRKRKKREKTRLIWTRIDYAANEWSIAQVGDGERRGRVALAPAAPSRHRSTTDKQKRWDVTLWRVVGWRARRAAVAGVSARKTRRVVSNRTQHGRPPRSEDRRGRTVRCGLGRPHTNSSAHLIYGRFQPDAVSVFFRFDRLLDTVSFNGRSAPWTPQEGLVSKNQQKKRWPLALPYTRVWLGHERTFVIQSDFRWRTRF